MAGRESVIHIISTLTHLLMRYKVAHNSYRMLINHCDGFPYKNFSLIHVVSELG